MNPEKDLIIQEYAKNPINNFEMENFSIKQHEWNFICWDDITVYLKIENNTIVNYSYTWNCSTITTASASFLADIIIWEDIQNILNRKYSTLQERWLDVSKRRKNSAVIWLLAAQNAILKYLEKDEFKDFEDLT